jgi:hypothetical protein
MTLTVHLKFSRLFIRPLIDGTYYKYVMVLSICPSIHPRSYLQNLSSEIDVVDNKYSLRQGLLDQGLSKSFCKSSRSLRTYKRIQFQPLFILPLNLRYWHDVFKNLYWVWQSKYAIH